MDNSGGSCSRKPVKIVIIDTHYVETDATSFKSVVQKLTGKDSSDHVAATIKAGKTRRVEHNIGGVEVPCATASGGHIGSSFFISDLSFKEFDWLLREMPPINGDLLRIHIWSLWANISQLLKYLIVDETLQFGIFLH